VTDREVVTKICGKDLYLSMGLVYDPTELSEVTTDSHEVAEVL
jgi:hypothetical protein